MLETPDYFRRLPKSPAHWISFDVWLKRVDAELVYLCGMGTDMLPDVDYREIYGSHYFPKSAARIALKKARQCF